MVLSKSLLDSVTKAEHQPPTYRGHAQMSVLISDEGDYTFPHRIDPSFRPGVWIDGTMAVEGREYIVTAQGYIYVKHVQGTTHLEIRAYMDSNVAAEDVPEIRIINTSSGDTKSNAPEQAPAKKVKYSAPTHANYVAKLAFKRATWQTGNDLLDLTREELEYLVTAGNAILKHLKEDEKNDSME